MQIISILKFVKFNWPYYFNEYINFFAYFSYCNQIFTFDCIFDDFNINYEKLYAKTILVETLPFLICGIFWLSFYLFRSKDKIIKITVVIIVVFTFFLPSVITQQLEAIKCKEIEGISYLLSNLNYKCYSEEHLAWVFSLFFDN